MEPSNKQTCSDDRNSETQLLMHDTNRRERTITASSEDISMDINSTVPPKSFSYDTSSNTVESRDTINGVSQSFTRMNQSSSDVTTPVPPKSFIIESNSNTVESVNSLSQSFIRTNQSAITSQPTSALMTPRSMAYSQPQTLFIQALSQLNESSLSFAVINHLKTITVQPQNNMSKIVNTSLKAGELSPPDSLASAPPSYSFVLRQMTARRRPRLMGTFIPSPSFVQHTPPPNYATAFDIYVDNPVPPPPPRVYNFSFASMPVVCPECGYAGMTTVISKITMCTHLCAFILCILFCWLCVPLPYVLRSCKNVYHYCGNCRNFLGMYCPTNPDNSYR